MNFAAELRALRDTCRILHSHRLIPLRARASRESPWPFARRWQPRQSQNHEAKIADQSAEPRARCPACAKWSGNVYRQLSRPEIMTLLLMHKWRCHVEAKLKHDGSFLLAASFQN